MIEIWLNIFTLFMPNDSPRSAEELQQIDDDYQAMIEPYIIRAPTNRQNEKQPEGTLE